MISLSAIALSLTIGVVSIAYGQEDFTDLNTVLIENQTESLDPDFDPSKWPDILGIPITELQDMINYCFDHASDSDNPVQDLVDKGLVNQQFNGLTCGEIKKQNDAYMDYLQKAEAKDRQEALEQSRQMREDALNQSARMGEDYGGVKYCSDFEERNFKVQPGDPYNLDRDGDGIACEG